MIGEESTVLCTCGEQCKETAAHQNDKPAVTLPSSGLLSDGVRLAKS